MAGFTVLFLGKFGLSWAWGHLMPNPGMRTPYSGEPVKSTHKRQ